MKYASLQKRTFAKFIDFLIVLFLGFVWRGGPGALIGFLYSITADGLPIGPSKRKHVGQSLGKRLMKIEVIGVEAHRFKSSLIRNAPIGVVTFLMIIPFWGWILSLLVGVPLFLIEMSLIVRAERHQRLGDVMAETEVVEVTPRVRLTDPLTGAPHEPEIK
jgi:uncharacterized RDD family membrane protein YckC